MAKAKMVKDVQNFMDELAKDGGKPLYELTPQEARDVLLSVQAADVDTTDVKKQKLNVKLDDGRYMPVVVMRPTGIDDDLPIVFYIHGGGWVMGDDVTHERLIRKLANNIPAAVVFPVYRQSPEAQFPQTTNDLFAVLQHFSKHAAQYGLDASKLAVAGDSVGGNMATVMAMMAKAQGNHPRIDFQLLFYPVTDAAFDTESYNEFAEGPWLTKKAMQWFWKQYAPNEKDWKNIYASPLRASLDDLEGLPPALIITGENDVLRDEGESYARKLDEAGVDVASVRFNGTIHDFVMLNGIANSAPSRAALTLAVAQLQNVFFTE